MLDAFRYLFGYYTLPIMLALCLMTYYAQNYAGIIGRSLVSAQKSLHFFNFALSYGTH